jgi:hypothetical protein
VVTPQVMEKVDPDSILLTKIFRYLEPMAVTFTHAALLPWPTQGQIPMAANSSWFTKIPHCRRIIQSGEA